MFYLI